MSLKPIDLKSIIPKIQQVSKSTQRDINQHKTNIHGQMTDQNVQIQNKLQKVYKSDKTYKGKLDNKGNKKEKENNGNNERQNSKNTNKSTSTGEKSNKNSELCLGTNFDIKI